MSSKPNKNQFKAVPAGKHAKPQISKLTREQYDQERTRICEEFEDWRKGVIITIQTQRKNLFRADALVMTFDNVLNSPLARLVAKAPKDDRYDLWAFNFAKKVQSYIAEDLGKVEGILKTYTFDKALYIAEHNTEDEIFKMIPYLSEDNMSIEDAWWGDITYQTIRPYGERLNETIRQLSSQIADLDERLEDDTDNA